jgi:hypothetical protein
MRLFRVVTLAASVFVVAPVVAQSPIRAGQWEITTQMDMANMPIKMREMKMTQCVTSEQLKDPTSALPTGSNANNQSCRTTDYKVDGNKVTWKMVCTGFAQETTGTGELVSSGDSYVGTMNMTTAQGAMTMKYTGKRLGDCTASSTDLKAR